MWGSLSGTIDRTPHSLIRATQRVQTAQEKWKDMQWRLASPSKECRRRKSKTIAPVSAAEAHM